MTLKQNGLKNPGTENAVIIEVIAAAMKPTSDEIILEPTLYTINTLIAKRRTQNQPTIAGLPLPIIKAGILRYVQSGP